VAILEMTPNEALQQTAAAVLVFREFTALSGRRC
jgi:hypothetical protein